MSGLIAVGFVDTFDFIYKTDNYFARTSKAKETIIDITHWQLEHVRSIDSYFICAPESIVTSINHGILDEHIPDTALLSRPTKITYTDKDGNERTLCDRFSINTEYDIAAGETINDEYIYP